MNTKHLKSFKIYIFLFLLISVSCVDNDKEKNIINNDSLNTLVPYGIGQFTFSENAPFTEKPIDVYTFLPDSINKNLAVVFVMHGNNRNGKEYCFEWVETAQKHQLLLICPNFDELNYPGSENYQLGGMIQEGEFIDSTKWTFNVIDSIFLFLQHNAVTFKKEYGVYGHSGGGQFVHRYAEFTRPSSAKSIITANSGWYTRIDTAEIFPYGFKDSPVTKSDIEKILNLPIVILLGEMDTDPNSSSLRKTEEAMRQGKHRLERGNFFFNEAKNYSIKNDISFNWKLQTVPNIGHSNKGMSSSAGNILNDILNK